MSLDYQVPLEKVDLYLDAHKIYLKKYYDTGVFVASGRKVPRTGGVILAACKSKSDLENALREDPFYQNGITRYEITEFLPTMHIDAFKEVAKIDQSNQQPKP